jgi:TolB protein
VRFTPLLAALVALAACSTTPSDEDDGPPTGRIVVSALHGPIRLSTVTGTDEKVILTGDVNAPDWAPSGDKIVYVSDWGGGEYGLNLTDTLGANVRLPVPLRSTWPQYSADGQWIYFFTQTSQPPRVYRIRPSGQDLQDLIQGSHPAPAPSGNRIAMMTPAGVWIGDPSTGAGAAVPNTESGSSLRWSPDGEWLAYRATGIVLIRPDGSGKRVLGTDPLGSLSWSRDSRWILAGSGGPLYLIGGMTAGVPVVTTLPVAGVYPDLKP